MFLRKPLTLPPQLDWQYKDEPALAEWSLRARAYNTDIANGLFVVLILIFAGFMYWTTRGTGFDPVLDGFTYILSVSLALSMTQQTTKFAYRLTASGLEFCEWKEVTMWLHQLLKWAAGITCVFMLMLATVHPAALIGAIAGPGMMGLMYLKMGTSSQFRRMHERFHQGFHPWTDQDDGVSAARDHRFGLHLLQSDGR